MADGKIVIAVDADAKKAQKELDTLSAKIDKMEAKLTRTPEHRAGSKRSLMHRFRLRSRRKMRSNRSGRRQTG